jgi:Domain of unknown function (DUF4169)
MSADLINLRRAKKNLARAEADKTAEANRQKFGQSKIEKNLSSFEKAQALKTHQGRKLEE